MCRRSRFCIRIIGRIAIGLPLRLLKFAVPPSCGPPKNVEFREFRTLRAGAKFVFKISPIEGCRTGWSSAIDPACSHSLFLKKRVES